MQWVTSWCLEWCSWPHCAGHGLGANLRASSGGEDMSLPPWVREVAFPARWIEKEGAEGAQLLLKQLWTSPLYFCPVVSLLILEVLGAASSC